MFKAIQTSLKHPDLPWAFITGTAAALVLSYAANTEKPTLLHGFLAIVGVITAIASFMFVARSNVDAYGKAATVVVTGVVAALCSVGTARVFSGPPAAPINISTFQSPTSQDYMLSGIVVAGLLVYLVYALLRPERF